MKALSLFTAILLQVSMLSAANYQQPTTTAPSMQNQNFVNNAETTVKIATDPKLGQFLTDNNGRTLYIFSGDKNKESVCYDQCAVTWPPFTITTNRAIGSHELHGDLGTLKRRDNTFQVTFNGLPLYYYVKDRNPGDVNGQLVENKWFVISPDASPIKSSKNIGSSKY